MKPTYALSPLAAAVSGLLSITSPAAAQTSADTASAGAASADTSSDAPSSGPSRIESVVVVGHTTNADITTVELERWQANDLADVFRTVPSVSVGGSLGLAQKVYIRGIEDTLLNITVDGAPQMGTLFHHIGRVGIEPELLEQVQVQAGAGEATSGFGAIGGAIRFRTKDAADLLAPGRRVGGMVKAGYFSNDGEKASVTGYGLIGDAWSLLGSHVRVDRADVEDGDGRRLLGTSADQRLSFVKASGRLGELHSLTLSFEQREESGAFGQRPNWPVLEGETLFPARAERDTYVANYRLDGGPLAQVEATLFQTEAYFEQNVYDRWGRYGASIETTGLDLRNGSTLGRHELTYGVEQRTSRVWSGYRDDPAVWSSWSWDPELGHFEEKGRLRAAYVQDHFQISAPVLLSFGLRFDDYELDQVTYADSTSSDGVSGNIGVLIDLGRNLRLSAGIAEAMRGKEIGDAFTLERRPGRISLAPGLRAEEVVNRELGLVFDDGRWIASGTVFAMAIDDVIFDQLGSGPPPQDAVYYENIGRLETDGLELRVGYGTRSLRADLFFTAYDAELNDQVVEGYEQIGLANASGDKWNLTLGYTPDSDWEFGWNVTRVQALNDIEVLHRAVAIGWIDAVQYVSKPGYTVHDVYAQWRPGGSNTWRVNIGVQNLFDETYREHSSVANYNAIPGWEGVAGLYETGRDVRLSVTAAF